MGYDYVVEVWHKYFDGKYGDPDTYDWKPIYEGNSYLDAKSAADSAHLRGYECIRTTWRPK